jgi:hypothetical protein
MTYSSPFKFSNIFHISKQQKTRKRQCVRRTNTKPLPPLHTKCPQYEKVLTRRIAECRIAIHTGQGMKRAIIAQLAPILSGKRVALQGREKEAAGQVIFSFLRHLLYTAPPLPATTQGQIGGSLVSVAEQKNKVKKSRIYHICKDPSCFVCSDRAMLRAVKTRNNSSH